MSNMFDSSASETGPEANYRCEEKLVWLRGMEDFRRRVNRSPDLSGPLLAKVIERDVLPQLFQSHSTEKHKVNHMATPEIDRTQCEALVELVLSDEPVSKLIDQIQTLVTRGSSLYAIYLNLLAPVARRLGELWEEDNITFIDITIAVSRLHLVIRNISRNNAEHNIQSSEASSIYLVPAPGEQHTFGLLMVEEFFYLAGWHVLSNHNATEEIILKTLAEQHLDIIGFSVNSSEHVDPLLDLIRKLDKISVNPRIAVLLGGGLFLAQPDYANKFKGATVVRDGVSAVDIAEALMSAGSRREAPRI
ncbi:MAG TPA: cobalamin B12-binding domain-containing protein [Rhodospirillaceae bacterium]|nr:cobalamin B12-binding domain-containing protein [Rhodospirillaceae bacterium]